MNIRTTNWANINKVKKTKVLPDTPQQKKQKIVEKILRRYDFWHNGVVIRTLKRCIESEDKIRLEKLVITEAFSLSMLSNAIISNDRIRIKNAIDLRINRRGIK